MIESLFLLVIVEDEDSEIKMNEGFGTGRMHQFENQVDVAIISSAEQETINLHRYSRRRR